MRKLAVLLVLIGILRAEAQNLSPQITANDVFTHIAYLASDDKKGRFPCTPELKQVADYIRMQFLSYGLKLMADSGFQYFTITIGAKLTEPNYIIIESDTIMPSDSTYLPFAFSDTGHFSADTIVFVGYGLDINQGDTLVWNDYKELNVKNKWVVAFMGYPKDTLSDRFFARRSSERAKANYARKYGAIGIIFIPQKDKLIPFTMPRFQANAKIPVIEISHKLANKLLNKNIDSLKQALNKNPNIYFTTIKHLETTISYKIKQCKTQNVIALLEGSDPQLKNRYIVIGAHYDHLGMGGYESGSRVPDTIAVHNGADDNASGTAGVLELAHYLANNKDKIKRSIIFITFGAEERGLLGSDYFAKNPTVPKQNIDFMINMDMIGLYNGKLSVMGVGTAKELKEIFNSIKYDSTELNVKLYDKAYGGSDHASFIAQNIPAVFFYASSAEHYHTPDDDIKYIKPKEEAIILKYIAKVAIAAANYPKPFTFVKQDEQSQGNRYASRVRLGIRPSFGYSGQGVKIGGIIADGPAEKAGLKQDDVIIKINNFEINDIYDYMNALSNFKKGDTITVIVIRNGKKKKLKVKL